MKKNYELDHVRVGLLPKRFAAFSEQAVQKCCDSVGKCIRLQIVPQRVVSVRRISQVDLDVVVSATMCF